MVAEQHQADDAALGDARDVMDVVDAEREDGRTDEDDGYALGEVEGSQARDEELGRFVRSRRST